MPAASPAILDTAFFSYFFLFPKAYVTDVINLDDLPTPIRSLSWLLGFSFFALFVLYFVLEWQFEVMLLNLISSYLTTDFSIWILFCMDVNINLSGSHCIHKIL